MSGFTWRWPLALLIGAIIIAVVVILVVRSTTRKRLTPDTATPTASTKPKATLQNDSRSTAPSTRAHRLPLVWNMAAMLKSGTVAQRYRLFRAACIGAVVLVALGLLASLGLVARPSTVDEDAQAESSRDIVLCLDVSGSALPFDREVIATYSQLVKSFKTERIALSIFNSTSRTVFPLTDDYSLVTKQLSAAMSALKGVQTQTDIDKMSDQQYQAISDWLSGTQNRKDATSLIGDGLVNCAAMVPGFSASANGSEKRNSPASIVFASDNVLSGSPLYTLQEALTIATKNDIHVDGLFTGASASENDATTVDMRTRVEAAGGTFLTRSQANSVDELVRSIESDKTKEAEQDAQINLADQPAPWIAALVILLGIAFVVEGWARR
ncbi:MAG: VWA domain-containing protein [Bifidobacteriaceae bacterium]|jgi:hypothetical protein|nr:VWA domain-containing protein [Bifidobacteriaceae bacterium]